MEIGDEAVQGLELVAWIDENVGPSGALLQGAVLCRPALNGTAGGGAHADHPAALGFGAVDDLGGLGGDHAVLGVHLVVQDVLLLHRAEGAQAHMEGHIGQTHPHVLHLLQKLLGEVEAGGGGGGGAHLPGVDGLVPLRVVELGLDIGRQGHFAQLLQLLQKDALIVKADQPVAPLQHLSDLGGELALAEGYLGTGLHLAAGPHQALPGLVAPVDEQQHLHGTAAGLPVADEPGGQHPGVIEHQAVPRSQHGGQIVKMHVFGLAGLFVQHQQPGGVPLLQRGLSDELLRQVKVKIGRFYGVRTSIPV